MGLFLGAAAMHGYHALILDNRHHRNVVARSSYYTEAGSSHCHWRKQSCDRACGSNVKRARFKRSRRRPSLRGPIPEEYQSKRWGVYLVQQSAPHRDAAAQHIASEMVDTGYVVDSHDIFLCGHITLYVAGEYFLGTWGLAWFNLFPWADPWAADRTWRWHNTKEQRCIRTHVYNPVLYTRVYGGTCK